MCIHVYSNWIWLLYKSLVLLFSWCREFIISILTFIWNCYRFSSYFHKSFLLYGILPKTSCPMTVLKWKKLSNHRSHVVSTWKYFVLIAFTWTRGDLLFVIYCTEHFFFSLCDFSLKCAVFFVVEYFCCTYDTSTKKLTLYSAYNCFSVTEIAF